MSDARLPNNTRSLQIVKTRIADPGASVPKLLLGEIATLMDETNVSRAPRLTSPADSTIWLPQDAE